jgi:hypothetical protein
MYNLEDEIYDQIYDYGFSSKSLQLIKANLDDITPEFLTDILVENINIHTQYKILIEYIIKIWSNNTNYSPNLLNYIAGVVHKLFYLAREYPLGKEVSESIKSDIAQIHEMLCDFRQECLEEEETLHEETIGEINSFDVLFETISKHSGLPQKINEMFRIGSLLFYLYSLNENQVLRNLDELALYLSRCLILWRLESLTDEEVKVCFEQASIKYSNELDLKKLETVLALEIQNYQFLQYGITHEMVKIIAKTFHDIHLKK